VYPYFFWSLIHGGLQSAFAGSGATNSSMPASRLLEIAWSPIIPYWFLYALFFCYVLAVATRRLPIWIVGVISFSLFVASFFIPTSVLGDIAYGFFYFTVGMIARKIDLLVWIPFSLRNIAIASVAFLTTALISYAIGVPERLPVISAVAGIVAVLMISLRLECSLTLSRATWLLILIGQCSMGIYVMHIIVLALGRTFLLRIFQISEPGVLLASITVLGVAIPLLVQVAAIRLNVGDILALPRSGRLIGRNKRFVLKWGSETTGASASATSSSSNQ
jgi:peptidoglycan/LPS O-acetylase OafA/YrhL